MDLTIISIQIHWLSVLVSALSAFAIGSLWYSPVLFGKTWQKLIQLTDEDIQGSNMPLIFGTSFVLNIVGALALEVVLGPDATLTSGLVFGLFAGITWVATSIAINYMYNQKPFKLFLIDAGYFVVFFAVEGIILGAW